MHDPYWYEKEIERLRAVIEDAIDTLEAMNLHVDNPLYERLCAALTVYQRFPGPRAVRLWQNNSSGRAEIEPSTVRGRLDNQNPINDGYPTPIKLEANGKREYVARRSSKQFAVVAKAPQVKLVL